MRKYPLYLATAILAIVSVISFSACRKVIDVGNKPVLNFVEGIDYITTDSTLIQDKKYMIKAVTSKAEDQSPNVSFEVVRTYAGSADTTVFYQDLVGAAQDSFSYVHTFTTLKRAGTERYTFTVKNAYGIVNQKILIMTVK